MTPVNDRKFGVFILSHGRADNVKTFNTLKKQGYTGKIYIILDNEDETRNRYEELFGRDNVIVFDKKKYFDLSDTADNSGIRSIVLPARNACHDIAKNIGLTHFLELDDDYVSFQYRYPEDNKLKIIEYKNLDKAFESTLDFLDLSGAITVAFAQGGDFIGGVESGNFKKGLLRKAMNSFFCRTDKPFKFYGRINEDTSMYVVLGNRGEKIFTITCAMVEQTRTQKSAGGLTDAYLDMGTYRKSFYSVMYAPSSVKVSAMGDSHKRIHHFVNWNACAPMILSQKYKKLI